MNQIVQYVLVFGVVGIFFAALYHAALDDISQGHLSQQERLELYKRQAQEWLVLVEMTGTSPATVDIVNAGAPTAVRHVYVNGVKDAGYTVWDGAADTAGSLPAGRLLRIVSLVDGDVVSIVTESGRVFRFG